MGAYVDLAQAKKCLNEANRAAAELAVAREAETLARAARLEFNRARDSDEQQPEGLVRAAFHAVEAVERVLFKSGHFKDTFQDTLNRAAEVVRASTAALATIAARNTQKNVQESVLESAFNALRAKNAQLRVKLEKTAGGDIGT